MKNSYHTIRKQGQGNEQELARFLARQGQFLRPMMGLAAGLASPAGFVLDERAEL